VAVLPLCPPAGWGGGGLTVVSDHPKAEEVLPSCDLQFGAVSVSIPMSFWSQVVQSVEMVGSQSGPLSRSF
jgi:hypothetical protein